MSDGFYISDTFTCNEDSPIETFVDGMRRTLNELQKQAVALDAKLELNKIYIDTMPRTNKHSIYKVTSVAHEREGITGIKEFSD